MANRPDPRAPQEDQDAAQVWRDPFADSHVRKSQRRSILIVAHTDALRQIYVRVVESRGFATITAGDGHSAVRVFVEHRSSILAVVLDLEVAAFSGVSPFDALRAIDPTVPLIVLSDRALSPRVAAAVRADEATLVLKPFSNDALARAIDGAVARRADQALE